MPLIALVSLLAASSPGELPSNILPAGAFQESANSCRARSDLVRERSDTEAVLWLLRQQPLKPEEKTLSFRCTFLASLEPARTARVRASEVRSFYAIAGAVGSVLTPSGASTIEEKEDKTSRVKVLTGMMQALVKGKNVTGDKTGCKPGDVWVGGDYVYLLLEWANDGSLGYTRRRFDDGSPEGLAVRKLCREMFQALGAAAPIL